MFEDFYVKIKELLDWFSSIFKSKYLIWTISKLKIEKYWNENTNFKKWDILRVNFWYNIGSEINKERFWIVISPNFISRFSKDLVILPLSSVSEWNYYKNKPDLYYIIMKDNYICLNTDSYILYNKIQNISKKRIIKKVWKINHLEMKNILEGMLNLYNK
jgi:mRNA-degrading endonuclease toxin of MazEF toxin-antitoxin module